MKKRDYLKLALQEGCYAKKAWIVSAFTVTKEAPDVYKKDSYLYRLVSESWGYSFVNASGELEKIEDGDPKQALFAFKERIDIDPSWAPNVKEAMNVPIGNLLANYVCIVSPFKDKIPFVTGRFNVKKIEAVIAPILKDTPEEGEVRDSRAIYVDELEKFIDALQFLKSLSQLCTWSVTKKSITPPPGIKEFKAKLLEKYKGKLSDPIELVKFENELRAYDSAYLAGDPSYGNFIEEGGRIKDTARKKMYLSVGADTNFSDGTVVNPVVSSLEEGWPTDPEHFTEMINGLRYGSYARGAETVKGGVSAKYLLRAANNFKIDDTDCKSKLGIHRRYTEKSIGKLIGRHVVDGTSSVFVKNKEIALHYVNKDLVVRSPMYCKLDGEHICRVCAGEKLAQFPEGLAIPLTEISGMMLKASMALMHATVLTTKKIELNKVLS